MSLLKNVFVVALVAFIAVGCSQQGGNSQDFSKQIALSDAGFKALTQLDWQGYASQVEPEGIARFNAMLKPGIEKMIMASQTDSVNLFGKNFNSQELQSLDDAGFFSAIMNMVAEVSPELKSTFSNMTNEALGAVADGDSLVHIVVRSNMMIGTRPVEEMTIQSVVKDGDEWKLKISQKIDGIAMMLSQSMPR